MQHNKTSLLATLMPLGIVICVSLVIVGGIVAWMAAGEGIGPGELVEELSSGQQSARPVSAQITPTPTRTPRPSPTPLPTFTRAPRIVTPVAPPTPSPTQPPLVAEASPLATIPSPTMTPTTAIPVQPESRIQAPIRQGSLLPERPATRLVIPAMNLDAPVILSPIVDQTWKVDHLGKDFIGHLEGTASPGEPSNVVLAGHVTIASNVYGPFAGLGNLKSGDAVILYVGDQPFTYIVDYRQLVERTDVDITYPTNVARVTLITCTNWSREMGAYQQRLIVVGHLSSGQS